MHLIQAHSEKLKKKLPQLYNNCLIYEEDNSNILELKEITVLLREKIVSLLITLSLLSFYLSISINRGQPVIPTTSDLEDSANIIIKVPSGTVVVTLRLITCSKP